VFPINPYNTNQYELPHSSLPIKPKKLTPLYSKKRSEIMDVNSRLPNIHNKDETTLTTNNISNKKMKRSQKKMNRENKPTLVKTIENELNNEPIKILTNETIIQPEKIEHQNKSEPEIKNNNNFELIWNSENLMPKIEEDAQYETPNLKRTKSFLGGKVFKLNDEENKTITIEEKLAAADLKSDDSAILLLNSASSSSSISNR
jgi:hypothetical protein